MRFFLKSASAGEGNTFNRCIVDKPRTTTLGSFIDYSAGEGATTLEFEDLFHDIILSGACGNKGNMNRMYDDRDCKGDSTGGWLWAVLDRCYPGVVLSQELVAGEERAGMAVGPASEKDKIKDGQLDTVAASKAFDKELFVMVGKLLGVAKILNLDRVDVWCTVFGGDLIEKFLSEEAVIGLFMVERNSALVCKENLPLVPENLFVLGNSGRQEGLT